VAGKLGSGGHDEPLVEINMIPLIDVVLVVMIIFMVTTKMIEAQAIKVNLPDAASGETTDSVSLGITVKADGSLFIDGVPVDEAGIRTRVKAEKGAGKDVVCLIAGDQDARHGDITHIIDVIKQEGVAKFAINIDPIQKPVP
jgi:biopolymer transport protein TolR